MTYSVKEWVRFSIFNNETMSETEEKKNRTSMYKWKLLE